VESWMIQLFAWLWTARLFGSQDLGGSVDRDSHTERRRSIVNEPDDTITL